MSDLGATGILALGLRCEVTDAFARSAPSALPPTGFSVEPIDPTQEPERFACVIEWTLSDVLDDATRSLSIAARKCGVTAGDKVEEFASRKCKGKPVAASLIFAHDTCETSDEMRMRGSERLLVRLLLRPGKIVPRS